MNTLSFLNSTNLSSKRAIIAAHGSLVYCDPESSLYFTTGTNLTLFPALCLSLNDVFYFALVWDVNMDCNWINYSGVIESFIKMKGNDLSILQFTSLSALDLQILPNSTVRRPLDTNTLCFTQSNAGCRFLDHRTCRVNNSNETARPCRFYKSLSDCSLFSVFDSTLLLHENSVTAKVSLPDICQIQSLVF